MYIKALFIESINIVISTLSTDKHVFKYEY